MKHRLGILFIVLLIGLDLSGTYLDSTSKANLKSKIALAISYYKEKAWFYYRRFTGEIPPQIVINNPREWSRFSLVCDALVLDNRKAMECFAIYIESVEDAKKNFDFSRFEKEMKNFQKRERGSQSNNREFRPFRFHPYQLMEKECYAQFQKKLEGMFTDQEWVFIENILNNERPWLAPDVDLRALRQIALKDEQRAILRPLTMQWIAMYLKTSHFSPEPHQPPPPPDSFEFPMEINPAENKERMEAEKKEVESLDKAKKELLAEIKGTLSSKQTEKWQVQCSHVQKTFDEEREWLNRGRIDFKRIRPAGEVPERFSVMNEGPKAVNHRKDDVVQF